LPVLCELRSILFFNQSGPVWAPKP
jgi:hypothetical protein